MKSTSITKYLPWGSLNYFIKEGYKGNEERLRKKGVTDWFVMHKSNIRHGVKHLAYALTATAALYFLGDIACDKIKGDQIPEKSSHGNTLNLTSLVVDKNKIA